MLPKNNLTHDEILKHLFHHYEKSSITNFVKLFLCGLSQGEFDLGLAAIAYMKNFPIHSFTYKYQGKLNLLLELDIHLQEQIKNPKCTGVYYKCEICGGNYNIEYPVTNAIQEHWRTYGSLMCSNELMLFLLESSNARTKFPNPSLEDLNVFNSILDILRKAQPEQGIRDMVKIIKKLSFFQTWLATLTQKYDGMGKSKAYIRTAAEYKLQLVMELLGYCGLLHTQKHRAPFFEWGNLIMMPRSNYKSDWQPPVDFWRGNDGIDSQALNFWFGTYLT